MDMNKIIELLNQGANNSAIARYLNDNGYYIPIYGWDEIKEGRYYAYDNKTGNWIEDFVIDLDNIKDDEELDRNWYRHYITTSDVAAIRKQCRVS